MVQGAGRATRNPKDHATVVVVGDAHTNFVIRPEALAALREELQAEIQFGYAQSTGKPVSDVDENTDPFLAQNQDCATWRTKWSTTATSALVRPARHQRTRSGRTSRGRRRRGVVGRRPRHGTR